MQTELPQLPPMSSPSAAPPAAALPSSPPGKAQPVTGGGRRLRQIMAVVGGGSLGIIVLAGIGEVVLRPELQPTTILAMFEAQTELKTLNQKMGGAPGSEVVLTEADYKAKLAEAERSGQAKAELAYQKDLAVVQSDKERIVGAYQTLYQRTNIIAQAGVQMEAQALQFRQRLLEQTNGGRAVVIGVYDMMCALGQHDACEAAQQARQGMVGEATGLTEGDLARKVNELMAGIPDPASLAASEDARRRNAIAAP